MNKILSSVPQFNKHDYPEFIEGSKKIFTSGKYILGEFTEKLENEFRHYNNVKYAAATSSATASIEIILKYINVENHEVLVSANSFVSILYAIQNSKAEPIIVDIDPKSYTFSIGDIKSSITKKTKAIIITHIAGYISPDIIELRTICEKNNIYLIEDCAHATGAKFNNIAAGSFGHAGVFSFYQSKVIASGTGGVIVTNDKKLYDFCKLMRAHGIRESDNIHLSSNWLISEFNALVAFLQMKRIKEIIEKRMLIGENYIKRLKTISSEFEFQDITETHIHPYYKFILKLKSQERTRYFESELESKGIQVGQCYPIQLNEHTSVRNYKDFTVTKKNADIFSKTHITLPLNLTLDDADYNYIIKCIQDIELERH